MVEKIVPSTQNLFLFHEIQNMKVGLCLISLLTKFKPQKLFLNNLVQFSQANLL